MVDGGIAGLELVEIDPGRNGDDACDDRRRDDLPASVPNASRIDLASSCGALLSFLAMANHGDGDEGVGGGTPVSSCALRNSKRSAQPVTGGH